MGIQTFVKKIQQKREIKKAIEKGAELTASGQTQVATTSGYVTVTTPTAPTAPTTPTTNLRTSGGGGYSYVDTKTGKGYEVSPTGVRTEITTPTTPSPSISIRNVQSQESLRGSQIQKTQEQLKSKLMEQLSKPTTTQLEKGSGKLRDYQFEQQTKRDLERYTQKETKKYQDLVNQGMDVDVANKELNRDISDYQKSLYEKEGYKVSKTEEGLQLEREVSVKKTIFQTDIFGRTKIVPTTYEEAKKTIPKSLFLEKASTPMPEKDINESEYFRPIKYLGEQIEKSKVGQKLIEKYPFIRTGEIYGKLDVTYQNPFKIEPTTESIKYLKVKLDPQRTATFMSNLGKGLLFAPVFVTGTYSQQALLEETGELIYDYTKGMWMRKNKLTGVMEPAMTRTQATGEFARLSEERQLNILKRAFSKTDGNLRVYLDEKSLLEDIGKAKVFMKESGLTESQIEIRLAKLFPNLYKVKTPIIQQEGYNIPSMVGGTGLKVIPRQPSITGEVIIDISRLPSNIKGSGELTSLLGKVTTKDNLLLNIKQEISLLGKTEVLLSPKLESKTKQKMISLFVQPQISVLEQPQKSLSLQKEALKQLAFNLQLLRQVKKTIPVEKQITSLREITKPIIKTPQKIIIKILPSKGRVSKEISGEDGEIFEVYGRRFGKDIKLFEAKEKQKSKEELVKFLKTTLGRSGYVEKEGKKLSFEELGLSDEFTPSKTRRDVIVQKKEFALESLFERKEIKGARRKRRLF